MAWQDAWDMDDDTTSNWYTSDIEAVRFGWDTTSAGWTDSVSGMFEGVMEYDTLLDEYRAEISLAIPSSPSRYLDTDIYHMLSLGIVGHNPYEHPGGAYTVLYRGEHFHPGLARNFDVTDPLEWVARITPHIPKKGSKQIIYYGAYSQAWRGRERRQGILTTATTVPQKSVKSEKNQSYSSRRRRQQWAVLLKKVWNVDALKCPKCGGRMKVISFIEQPSVIKRILKHLDIWDEPRPPPESLEMVCEPCADYIPWKDDVPEIEVG